LIEYHCGACRKVFSSKKAECHECREADRIYIDEEFYCGECVGYFNQKLRANVTGNFTIQCPECGHHHYRYIENGFITDRRCNDKADQLDIIIALKAKYRKTPRHNDPDYRRSQLKAMKL
jgi:hypothetical protein